MSQPYGPLNGGLSPERVMQLQEAAGNRAVMQFVGGGQPAGGAAAPPNSLTASPPNRTGMPDRLKSGLESMSGMDLSDVRVHYQSPKPAELGAHAYAQGNDIHVAPGQERHLPHEGWHVVQQRQGRVSPTMQLKGEAINDDGGLEREADIMGTRAIQASSSAATDSPLDTSADGPSSNAPVQRALVRDQEILDERGDTFRWGKFKGTRDDANRNHVGQEEGRGTKLTGGQDAKTTVKWNPIDPGAGEGKRVEAIVGPDHNLGTSPSHANAKARVSAFKALSGKSYISGHLMNEKLGGPGDDQRNLTAISGTANTLQSSNIEKFVRDPVNEDGDWYKYIVDVEYSNDSAIYKNSSARLKAYNKLDVQPTGVQISNHSNTEKLVQVRYASKLTANWYHLNTAGGRYGAEYKKNITIDSPLDGGKAEVVEDDGEEIVAPRPDKKTRGRAARTEIDPEELVLTTSNLLKSVIENREGLIAKLNEVRGDNKELSELIAELEQLVAEGEGEAIELRDIVYDYGYDWGYDHGYASYNEEMDNYQDNGQNGPYSEGYAKGYDEGLRDAKQYEIGHRHGREDGYYEQGNTEFSRYYDLYDNQSYRDGYDKGDADGRYDYWYEQGEKDGMRSGLEDEPKAYASKEDGYSEGYDNAYAEGLRQSLFAPGKRPIFENIDLAYDESAASKSDISHFPGTTIVQLSGKGLIIANEKWYFVEMLFSTHHVLQKYMKDNKTPSALMKKDWIRQGK
ncbi:DUF4157 domain-containing protein [Paenibacillus sp. IB182493]|uniref:DUF4157 domain-containing protein n=2 Tax=Paenibacillus arenilitoris TaxID=2772299 RepID=A0A927CSR1_9BACL|nr:DUF4157 domain-containing protein [Paenibacillus arenilitoris]